MRSDRGIALVLVLITLAVCSALGLGLVLTTTSERLAGANYSESLHVSNAADAALHVAARELGRIADWDAVLAGGIQSPFMAGASPVDLAALTNELTCGRSAGCTEAERRRSTGDRPWGDNNPRWQVFLRSPLSAFLHIPHASADMYIVAWVGDDARERDGDPGRDGAALSDGRNVVRVLAEAFGPTGARHAVEADVVRQPAGIRVQSWRVRAGLIP
jgi:Tfp pilus assembly protein PilX